LIDGWLFEMINHEHRNLRFFWIEREAELLLKGLRERESVGRAWRIRRRLDRCKTQRDVVSAAQAGAIGDLPTDKSADRTDEYVHQHAFTVNGARPDALPAAVKSASWGSTVW